MRSADLNVVNLENLIIEIRKPNSKPFLIATWYRPHGSPTELFSSFESFIDKLDSLDLEYYLLGDFNCNLASPTPDVNTPYLLEISDLYGLKQLINEPTRITESSSTLIDLIYTNYTDRVSCSGVSHIGISDHSLAYVYRKLFSILIQHLKGILLSLIEISEILIEKIFEMKFLNKTGLPMNMKIQICYGLTEKQNFCALSTLMLRFELDVLN